MSNENINMRVPTHIKKSVRDAACRAGLSVTAYFVSLHNASEDKLKQERLSLASYMSPMIAPVAPVFPSSNTPTKD